MDVFLLNCLLLVWASIGAARRLTSRASEQILAASLLAWGNIVATGLLLSGLGKLGEPAWFLSTSLLLSGLVLLLLGRLEPEPASPVEEPGANPWLRAAFAVTVTPLALGLGAIAWTYAPNHTTALAVDLPRVMYYLGQGNLAPFDTADLRQTCLPFNHHLLLLFGAVYHPPLQCLNIFNLAAWALAALAVRRLCRLAGFGLDTALLACWLVLTATAVVAQANSTTAGLSAAVAVLSVVVFSLRWTETRRARDAMLAGLAAGLAAGSDLGVFVLGLGAGLVWLLRLFWGRRTDGMHRTSAGIRPWIFPALLAVAFAIPFALLNLADPAHGAWMDRRILLGEFFSSFIWREVVAAFGLPGLLILFCALVCLFRFRTPTVRPVLRRMGGVVLVGAALGGVWFSAASLLHHPGRPLRPVLDGVFVPPALLVPPLLMEHRLSEPRRINVDSDGVNERIFPLLALGRNQQITSRWRTDPAAYNLLSRSRAARQAADLGDPHRTFHVLMPVPAKRTAGVEFLAAHGDGAAARDYFGLAPRAGQTAPGDGDRNLLVTLERLAGREERPEMARLRVTGLNAEDRLRLAASFVHQDGRVEPSAEFTADGAATFSLSRGVHHLELQLLDAASGVAAGRAVLPSPAPADEAAPPLDPVRPSDANSIFVTDLVLGRNNFVTVSEGLTPAEGPFPQWDIPRIRWARRPSFTLRILPVPNLTRVQLAYSARLHVRKKAVLEVVWNGRVVRSDRLEGQTVWLDRTLDLPATPGENVLEFRDALLVDEPDWMEYLDRYPDIKNYFDTMGIPLEEGAREHYEKVGHNEGRTVKRSTRPAPAPGAYYFIFRNIRLEGFHSP